MTLIADHNNTPLASPRDIHLVGGLLPTEPFPENCDSDRSNGEAT